MKKSPEDRHAERLVDAAMEANNGDLEACIEIVDEVRAEIVETLNKWKEIAERKHFESGFYPIARAESICRPDWENPANDNVTDFTK